MPFLPTGQSAMDAATHKGKTNFSIPPIEMFTAAGAAKGTQLNAQGKGQDEGYEHEAHRQEVQFTLKVENQVHEDGGSDQGKSNDDQVYEGEVEEFIKYPGRPRWQFR